MTNQQINKLYFIALVPDEKLRTEVKSLKEELKDNFGASHALKSPAHITLQMPFRRNEADEENIIQTLQKFGEDQTSFEVSMEGFDCFPPRVIFIKILDHKPLIKFQSGLKNTLQEELGLENNNTFAFHPHMTIATRDLTEEAFELAWPQYISRKFKASFKVSSLYLLKHNGKFWDIYKEFPFEG